MTRKCHNHRPETNPLYYKEETQSKNSHMTATSARRKLSNQPSLHEHDDCETRKQGISLAGGGGGGLGRNSRPRGQNPWRKRIFILGRLPFFRRFSLMLSPQEHKLW